MKDNAKAEQLKKDNKELELKAYTTGYGRYFSSGPINFNNKIFLVNLFANSKFFMGFGLLCGLGGGIAKLIGTLSGSSSSSSGSGGANSTNATNMVLNEIAQINATVNLVGP